LAKNQVVQHHHLQTLFQRTLKVKTVNLQPLVKNKLQLHNLQTHFQKRRKGMK